MQVSGEDVVLTPLMVFGVVVVGSEVVEVGGCVDVVGVVGVVQFVLGVVGVVYLGSSGVVGVAMAVVAVVVVVVVVLGSILLCCGREEGGV